MAGTKSFTKGEGEFMTAAEDPSLKARKAAALSMGAAAMKEKSEGLGSIIAGALPAVAGIAADYFVPGSGKVASGITEGIVGAVDTSAQDAAEADRLAQEAENQMAAAQGRQAQKVGGTAGTGKAAGQALGSLASSIYSYAKGK